MKYVISILSLAILIGFTSCNSSNSKQAKEKKNTEVTMTKTSTVTGKSQYTNQGVVEKVLQTPSYTYVLLKSGSDTNWVAVSRMEVKAGETLYYNGGLEMNNFHSKSLNRTFKKVALVQEASTNPVAAKKANKMGAQSIKPKIKQEKINIKPVNGSITIAELYANKSKYEGKVIKVRGKVTKYNPDIMGKNWIHIQDGTKSGSNFDLTITTKDRVRMGDVITFEGKITLNKDFGAGYFYPVIMEEAKVLK